MESSPTFEEFMREDDSLATKLRTATECCFDSDSGHAVRRTCNNIISQAVSTRHTSLLPIWLTLVLTLIVNVAVYTL